MRLKFGGLFRNFLLGPCEYFQKFSSRFGSGTEGRCETGGGRCLKYRPPPGVPASRWMEHVRSRSCEVCTGRDLAVLAGHLAARGSWDSATPEAGSNSAPAALQPPVADVRRSTAPEASPVHCSREACLISSGGLGKPSVGPGKEMAGRPISAERRCAQSPA